MARRVREHPWGATPLGPAAAWPPSLRATLEMVLSNGFAMVALWGRDLVQIYNDRYAALIGAKHPQALGRPLRAIAPEVWPLTAPIFERVLAGETCTFRDTDQAILGGSPAGDRRFTGSYSPLREESGAIGGVLVTLLETAQRDQADRARDQFLTTLSHELRTPLASILLWARALRSGSVAAHDFERATDAIVQSAESQLQLIEDLVDLTRLESGLIQLDRQTHLVEDVARATVQLIGPTAAAKKIAVEFHVAPDVGAATFDRGRYQQVLCNLLANAVKFTTEHGRVSLRIRRDGDQLEAMVTDDGQGIEPDALSELFHRFRRADKGEKRRRGSLGVGLALCRHLVELHDGTIEARSDGRGRGSTFVVRIPWIAPEADAEGQDVIAVATAGALTTLNGLRVLVVEDDEDMRDIMRWTLERAGAQVLTVGSGSDALSAIDAGDRTGREPDVLVCDLGLPGMNGYDLIAHVAEQRRARGKRAIPACAVSAFVRDVDRERAIDAGFDSYLRKPMTAQRLIDAVMELAAVADEERRA